MCVNLCLVPFLLHSFGILDAFIAALSVASVSKIQGNMAHIRGRATPNLLGVNSKPSQLN